MRPTGFNLLLLIPLFLSNQTLNGQFIYNPGPGWCMGFEENFAWRDTVRNLSFVNDSFQRIPNNISRYSQLEGIEITQDLADNFESSVKQLVVMPGLKTIYFYQCSKVPKSLVELKQIEHVRLTNSFQLNLDSLISVLIQLPNLKTIDFYTPITDLPKSINQCKKLSDLTFPSCSSDIPESFFQTIGSIITLRSLCFYQETNSVSKHITYLQNIKKLQIHFSGNYPENIIKISKLKLECLLLETREVPGEISLLTHLKELSINQRMHQYYFLSDFPFGVTQLVGLEKLTLCGSGISTLPEQISNLTRLQYLNLSNNRFATMPDIFTGLRFLEYINFSNNRLFELPNSVSLLNSLKSLILDNNGFSRVPACLDGLAHLEYLSLQGNQVRRFPDGIEMERLRHVAITGSVPYFSISPDVIKIRSLESLILERLDTVPKNIGELKSLTLLSFSLYVPNAEFYPYIASVESLHEIEIRATNSTSAEALLLSLRNNTSLSKLSLVLNGQMEIPSTVTMINSLKELVINGGIANSSRELKLPADLAKLTTLEILRVHYCGLTSMLVALKIKQLRVLDLSNNYIAEIPDAINQLDKLEDLLLKFNKLNSITQELNKMTSIEFIDLRFNEFSNRPNWLRNDIVLAN